MFVGQTESQPHSCRSTNMPNSPKSDYFELTQLAKWPVNLDCILGYTGYIFCKKLLLQRICIFQPFPGQQSLRWAWYVPERSFWFGWRWAVGSFWKSCKTKIYPSKNGNIWLRLCFVQLLTIHATPVRLACICLNSKYSLRLSRTLRMAELLCHKGIMWVWLARLWTVWAWNCRTWPSAFVVDIRGHNAFQSLRCF